MTLTALKSTPKGLLAAILLTCGLTVSSATAIAQEGEPETRVGEMETVPMGQTRRVVRRVYPDGRVELIEESIGEASVTLSTPETAAGTFSEPQASVTVTPGDPGAVGPSYQYEGQWQAVLQEGGTGRQLEILHSCDAPLQITARSDRLLQLTTGTDTSVVQVAQVDDDTYAWTDTGSTLLVTKATDGNFMRMETLAPLEGQDHRVVSYLRCGSAGATANSQMCVAGNACAIPVLKPPVVRTVEDQLNQLFELSPIEFDVDRATIRPTSRATLDEAAAIIKANPQAGNLMIIGHTDSDASEAHNLSLSQRRADSVKAYLVTQHSVNGARLSTDGKGESQLLVNPENSREDKQRNRRIEWRRLSSAPLNRSQ